MNHYLHLGNQPPLGVRWGCEGTGRPTPTVGTHPTITITRAFPHSARSWNGCWDCLLWQPFFFFQPLQMGEVFVASNFQLRRAAMNWRSLRNLRLGSTHDRKPAKGRGRIQRQVARAFQASGKVVLSSSTIYRWVYPKKTAPGWLERWSVFTVLRVMCHRVGRAKTTGTPWLWKLRQPLDKV